MKSLNRSTRVISLEIWASRQSVYFDTAKVCFLDSAKGAKWFKWKYMARSNTQPLAVTNCAYEASGRRLPVRLLEECEVSAPH
jgi:hypothetical protein